jgi:NAD(P)-dependent dehydrogenase (short-subunit alcohol dehydrogenase family)
VDQLIKNAGCGSAGARLSQIEVSAMTEQFKLHYGAALVLIQTLRDRLSSAEIVNITSRLGLMVQHQRGDFASGNFAYAYRIAKAAQNMLSLCLSDDPELAGCRVLSINPRLLQTASGLSDAVYSAEEGARAVLATI